MLWLRQSSGPHSIGHTKSHCVDDRRRMCVDAFVDPQALRSERSPFTCEKMALEPIYCLARVLVKTARSVDAVANPQQVGLHAPYYANDVLMNPSAELAFGVIVTETQRLSILGEVGTPTVLDQHAGLRDHAKPLCLEARPFEHSTWARLSVATQQSGIAVFLRPHVRVANDSMPRDTIHFDEILQQPEQRFILHVRIWGRFRRWLLLVVRLPMHHLNSDRPFVAIVLAGPPASTSVPCNM